MISYSEALAKVTGTGRRNTLVEDVLLQQAVGRVIAQSYHSDQAVPEFGNSAMDGFAVKSIETQLASSRQPLRFSVLGSIAAGDLMPTPSQSIDQPLSQMNEPRSGVWEIMTGAPIPHGFDAVVKIEDVVIVESKTEMKTMMRG